MYHTRRVRRHLAVFYPQPAVYLYEVDIVAQYSRLRGKRLFFNIIEVEVEVEVDSALEDEVEHELET